METRRINGEMLTLDEAVNKNNRLIWSVVQRFVKKGATMGLDPEDLHSIAAIGIIKAFKNFDPDVYPVKFSTYAVPLMVGEVQRHFRDHGGLVKFSRRVIELGNKISYAEMVDEKPEITSLHFDVTVDEVNEALEYVYNKFARSTEEVIFNTDGDDITLGDQLGDNKLSDYTSVNVEMFLASLEPRDRVIIEFMMQEKTQSEIGQALGVTQVQVSRLIRKLHPVVEEYFGYPYGYFSNRKKVNDAKEKIKMNSKKKKIERKEKGDLELAKKLLAETKRTPCSIAKEANITDSSAYYWAKKIREPEAEENPVEVSYIEPVKEDEKVQEHLEKIKEELISAAGVPSAVLKETTSKPYSEEIKTSNIELGVPIFNVHDEEEKDYRGVKLVEEFMIAEEAAKLAEEQRMNLLKKSSINFGYHIASNEVSPSDLHVLFTQAGHTASASGLEKLNVNIVITTEKIHA